MLNVNSQSKIYCKVNVGILLINQSFIKTETRIQTNVI